MLHNQAISRLRLHRGRKEKRKREGGNKKWDSEGGRGWLRLRAHSVGGPFLYSKRRRRRRQAELSGLLPD